jgi:hypothetical protein
MARSIADIIAKHEAAHAKRASQEAKLIAPEREAEFKTLDRLEIRENQLIDKLINAECGDDEFLTKVAYLLKSDAARWAVVAAAQKHLDRRLNSGGG